ncbi:lysylphosphatidylglycerol synthase domain-containing protein [Methylomonas koyamae]|uniref:lysylphosphatidylglycerol synthase domain-containing protein n=1 Tax=Methylomonas koyamae TaxID=702114 RepID=UPI0006CF5241|nr:lysylphosphatidylglycerol synthase domain-containing protein [Methylomonas koyamae]
MALGLDRLYEFAVNLLLLAAGVFLLARSPLAAIADWQAVGVGLIGALLSIAVAGRFLLGKPGRFTQALQSLFRRWRRHSVPRAVTGADHDPAWDWRTLLGQRRIMVQALLWSLLGWAALLAELWLLLDWVHAPQGVWNFLLVLVAMRLAFLLPLPGGVGSLEMAMFWVFQYLHAAPGAALALIALMRVRDAVFVAAGLGCMAWLGGWRAASRAKPDLAAVAWTAASVAGLLRIEQSIVPTCTGFGGRWQANVPAICLLIQHFRRVIATQSTYLG